MGKSGDGYTGHHRHGVWYAFRDGTRTILNGKGGRHKSPKGGCLGTAFALAGGLVGLAEVIRSLI